VNEFKTQPQAEHEDMLISKGEGVVVVLLLASKVLRNKV